MHLLLLLYSLIGLISFNPKDLVIEVGVGNNDILQINNWSINKKDVNWNEVGTYSVEYYNHHLGKEGKRNVHIIPADFNSHGSYNNIFTQVSDFDISEIIEVDGGYYVCGTVPSYDPFQLTPIEQNYGFIAYLNNEALEWQLTFFDQYSYVSSIVIIEGQLYALLTIANSTGTSLKLLEISVGKIKSELIIADNMVTFGDEMVVINKRLFIICSSSSRTGYLSYIDDSEYIGILEIDYHNFAVKKSYCFGNIGTNKLLEIDYDDNTIALVIAIDGTAGQFKNLYNKFSGNFLVVLDLNLVIQEYRYINHQAIKSFFITANDYCVIGGSDNGISAWVDIIVMNRNIKYVEVFKREIPGGGNSIHDIYHTRTFAGQNFIGVNIYNRTQKEQQFSGIIEFTNNQSLQHTTFYPSNNQDYLLDDIIISKSGMMLLARRLNNTFKIDEFLGIRKESFAFEVIDDTEYHNAKLFLNGNQIGLLGESDNQVFGHHQELMYIDDIVDVYLMNRYYVPAHINIKTNQVYDLGIILTFNGSGLLNGEEIENEYCIETVGEYSLIVQGNGEERHIINFRVEALSLEDKICEANQFKLEKAVLNPEYIEKEKIAFENYLHNYRDDIGIIITIIISLSFIVLAIVPKMKQRKKHK